jgi:hypothetical protein
MTTKIMPCDCMEVLFVVVKQAGADRHKCPRWEMPWFARTQGAQYQDAKFGTGRRLHNRREKDSKHIGWTCSVCGKEKTDL